MKQLAGEKHMENDCFPRTLKLKMLLFDSTSNIFPRNLDVVQSLHFSIRPSICLKAKSIPGNP
jgi:hypothetical protein